MVVRREQLEDTLYELQALRDRARSNMRVVVTEPRCTIMITSYNRSTIITNAMGNTRVVRQVILNCLYDHS